MWCKTLSGFDTWVHTWVNRQTSAERAYFIVDGPNPGVRFNFTLSFSVHPPQSCTNATNLVEEHPPLQSSMRDVTNDFTPPWPCDSWRNAMLSGGEKMFFDDVAPGETIAVRLSVQRFQVMRWGGECPGDNLVVCTTTTRGRLIWTNDQATTERVFIILDTFVVEDTWNGDFEIKWEIGAIDPTGERTRSRSTRHIAGLKKGQSRNST